jgi:hypothetical protein
MANLQRNIEVLKAKDCSYLSIHDTSYYPVAPDEANIQILMAGYDTPFEFAFVLNEVNVFNSYSFGLTTSETDDFVALPDGLYTIHLTTCPDTGVCTRYHIRTCQIDCRLALQWAKYAQDCEDEKILYYLDRIEFLLRGAEANADLCNPDKAIELYRKADDLLRRFELDC